MNEPIAAGVDIGGTFTDLVTAQGSVVKVSSSRHDPAEAVRRALTVAGAGEPGVLAHVLNVISHANINVEEMRNVICEGAVSACAQIALDGALSDVALTQIRQGNANILGVSQQPIAHAGAASRSDG